MLKIVVIEKDEELSKLFKLMSRDMLPDSPPEKYTKDGGEVVQLIKTVKSDEEIQKRMENLSGIQKIMFHGKLISLCLTADSQHGHDWHLSMCQIVPGPGGVCQQDFVPDDMQETICDAFFGAWMPIENPGKMLVVDHFVGDSREEIPDDA